VVVVAVLVVVVAVLVVVVAALVVVVAALVVLSTVFEVPPQAAMKKNKQATTNNFFIHTSVPYAHRSTVCLVFLKVNQDYVGVGGGT
jgi:hypothetical protein